MNPDIRFDPSIPELGDLAISHAIISVSKFLIFFTPFFLGLFMKKYNIAHEFVVTIIFKI
jgi:hypothetical protein